MPTVACQSQRKRSSVALKVLAQLISIKRDVRQKRGCCEAAPCRPPGSAPHSDGRFIEIFEGMNHHDSVHLTARTLHAFKLLHITLDRTHPFKGFETHAQHLTLLRSQTKISCRQKGQMGLVCEQNTSGCCCDAEGNSTASQGFILGKHQRLDDSHQ